MKMQPVPLVCPVCGKPKAYRAHKVCSRKLQRMHAGEERRQIMKLSGATLERFINHLSRQ